MENDTAPITVDELQEFTLPTEEELQMHGLKTEPSQTTGFYNVTTCGSC